MSDRPSSDPKEQDTDVMTITMTRLEQRVLLELLKRAGDDLSNNGCNDYTLPNTPLAVDIVNCMARENVGPEREPEADELRTYDPAAKSVYTADWYVLWYISKRIAGTAHFKPTVG